MPAVLQNSMGSLEDYANLILNGLLFMFGAMLVVFLLYRLVSSLIRPRGKVARMVRVAFGAVYVLILLLAVILAAERFGYDVSGVAGIAILVVLAGAVVVFFAIPFLPRLPFMIGDTVLIRGSLGTVDGITTYQTVIRTFDGRLVFIPNVLVLASDIQNFSTVPIRRVELKVELHVGDDLEAGRAGILAAMQADSRVLDDPPPAVFLTDLDQAILRLQAYCWVKNADWLATQDSLLADIARLLTTTEGVRPVERELRVRGLDGRTA